MAYKVDPTLMKELKHYGMKDASKCFHCGNCTATCPLSEGDNTFPRKLVKYAQMGLREKLLESPEPWLCYYCGDCTDRCPRGAEPGETMMSLRRWLTAQYDWTGFAKKFYTSEAFEIGAISLVALLVLAAFLIFHGPVVTDKIALNTFAPAHVIEILDIIIGSLLAIVLLSNVFRCAKFVMPRRKFIAFGPLRIFEIPFGYYIRKVVEGIWNMVAQYRWKDCTDRTQWIMHLFLFTGYSSIFLMVVVGIRWFQRDSVINPDWPTVTTIMSIVGYYATAAIMMATTYAIVGRIRKSKPMYKSSHSTDWAFLILLQLTTLTGILVHIFIYLGLPMATYVIYVIHMMIAVPMLVLEVPFAKWAHLAYRPTVLFLVKVKELYDNENAPAPAAVEPAPETPKEEAQAEAA